ncbi:unnamed protein product [Rotaria sordida]|uniref:Uncharacterized protein n=1 Tax=Rotaria sordida TaxID=392033 RepID=A0A813QMJ9_9BILA|nr:unnamed protein product [Rotaria sordida]CAF0816383.1 unnamed protein product [Rotaria sordida]
MVELHDLSPDESLDRTASSNTDRSSTIISSSLSHCSSSNIKWFGAVALVHDNTQLPNIEAAGIELASGRRQKIAYRKKTTYLLSSPYTTCTKSVSPTMQAMFEYHNNTNYGYSEALCYQLCGQIYA